MNYIENDIDENEITIDILTILQNLWTGIKRFGWLVLLLAAISAGINCFLTYRSYYPYYTSLATFTVNLSDDSDGSLYDDNMRASQMSKTFPYIIYSGVLKNIIAKELGESDISETIMAENVENTNLFTIKVTSWDAERAYNVLQAVIKNYPLVAETVVGNTKLTMLDETGIPTQPINIIKYKNSLKKGIFPGAILGILVILIYAVTRNTIHKAEDVSELTSIKHLGALPKVTFKKRGKNKNYEITFLNDKLSPLYRENIYKIRARVDKIMLSAKMKSIIITSAIPGEGKSTLTFNLALAMAEIGKKVVLVDCDLRHPSIKKMLPHKEGAVNFDDVLVKGAELKDALIFYDELNITALACEKPIENAAEMIGTSMISNIIHELEESFDYIIIDTAPSAILSDTYNIAQSVDGAILVIKHDYSKVNQILEALDYLSESSDVKMIGYVLNGVHSSLIGYGYGYGYGKYGKSDRYGGYEYNNNEG